MMSNKDTFKAKIQKTREYLDRLERHYDYVQESFAEFDRRIQIKWNEPKYNSLVIGLCDAWVVINEIIGSHDMSKLSHEEFIPYRQHFFPIDENEAEDNKEEYALAVKHHIKNNQHHWQNGMKNGRCSWYVLENVLDWNAMAKELNQPMKEYWNEVKDIIDLPDYEKEEIELIYDLFEEDI